MYDYEACQHNPVIGKFTAVDPRMENYYSISPYVYCMNNPVRSIEKAAEGIV